MTTERPTIDLARSTAEDLARLVHDELALARDELRRDIASMRAPALALTAGVAVCAVATELLLGAMTVRRPRLSARIAVGLLGAGGLLAVLGWRSLPGRVLAETRARLSADARVAAEVMS